MRTIDLPGEIPLKPGMEWEPGTRTRFDGRSSVKWRGGHCKDVVYDVLAYYKPYTSNARDWGIYYVAPNITDDLNELIEKMYRQGINRNTMSATILAYPSLITIHEVCHHALENVRRKLGIGKIYERDDEGLCEYTAFKLIEESGNAYLAPMFVLSNDVLEIHYHGDHVHVITRFGDYVLPVLYPLWHHIYFPGYPILEINMNGIKNNVKEALAILYKWWGRDQDPLYRPRISSNYSVDFLSRYWLQLRGDLVPYMDHVLTNKPVNESLWLRMRIDEEEKSMRVLGCDPYE